MKIVLTKQRNNAKWDNVKGGLAVLYNIHVKLVIELTRNSTTFRRTLMRISTNTGERTTGRGPGKYL
jgi:hypothetical protein